MDTILSQIEALRKELNEHNYNYYVLDTPSISDFEFDQKLKELQELEAKYPQYKDPNSRTVGVGGEINQYNSWCTKYLHSLWDTYRDIGYWVFVDIPLSIEKK